MGYVWDEQVMWAKYHLSTSKRLFENFSNYETKRFLSSCLTEMALSATSFVNAVLLCAVEKDSLRVAQNPQKRVEQFRRFCGKKLHDVNTAAIVKIFEVKRAQKNSPIELLRQDKILLLDDGEYRAITKERIKELIDSLEQNIRIFENHVHLL